jgi:hypothetical protein
MQATGFLSRSGVGSCLGQGSGSLAVAATLEVTAILLWGADIGSLTGMSAALPGSQTLAFISGLF